MSDNRYRITQVDGSLPTIVDSRGASVLAIDERELNPPDPEGLGFLAQAACSLVERSGLMPSAPAGLKPARLRMTCAEFLSRGARCPQWSHR
ncbi:Uncharacterised protein [Mycobacteroides abscessus subsp. massiliense]|nr:Uncharacterised protein [Mycobacteroides abscessus subsp. massiliense]